MAENLYTLFDRVEFMHAFFKLSGNTRQIFTKLFEELVSYYFSYIFNYILERSVDYFLRNQSYIF